MNGDLLSHKVKSAYIWSTVTETVSKMTLPVLNMILARLLAPKVFGIMATITMVISFSDLLTENGFQKYLIQHQFTDSNEEKLYMSVGFWSNLAFSLLLFFAICLFSKEISFYTGSVGHERELIVSAIMIPINAVIGIQNCKLKKDLNFKSLFYVRTISSFVPLFVTVPLAYLGLNCWSMVIGNIAGSIVRFLILVKLGKFVPKLFFSIEYFLIMLKSGMYTMIDGVLFWLTSWVDTMLIASSMNSYYLGLYKNSVSMVTSLFAIITSSIIPVLYSTLSKLQDDNEGFNKTFLNVQHNLSVFLLPMSIGLFAFRETATVIMLGHKWMEASDIIGIMALTTAIRTIFVSFYGDVYRSKGYFKVSPMLQIVDLMLLVPVCLYFSKEGFWSLVYSRAFMKLDLVIPEMVAIWFICKISPRDTLKNIMPSLLSASLMGILGRYLHLMNNNLVWQFVSIIICVIFYFSVLFISRNERKNIKSFIRKVGKHEKV